jgi:hypothetical protein
VALQQSLQAPLAIWSADQSAVLASNNTDDLRNGNASEAAGWHQDRQQLIQGVCAVTALLQTRRAALASDANALDAADGCLPPAADEQRRRTKKFLRQTTRAAQGIASMVAMRQLVKKCQTQKFLFTYQLHTRHVIAAVSIRRCTTFRR